MTFLFLSRLFYPHIGGVEKHALEIAKLLVKNGHKVTVITERFDQSLKEEEIINGINVLRINVGKNEKNKKFLIWKWIFKNRKIIKNTDIIHCHDVFFWYLPLRFLYFRKPVFTTFHGYETIFPPTTRAIISRKISEVLSFGNICVGDYVSKWYGTKANFTTYGGVNFLNEAVIKKINSPVCVTFIGRLEKDNGIEIYLNVLKILKENKINFNFTAIGDGSLRKKAEEYGSVLGFIENIQEQIKKSDIIFASSFLSILETFIQKKRVFAADQNILKRDYLELTPFKHWITINHNPVFMAENIMDYLNNPLKSNLILEKEYQWAKTQSWENVYNLYLQLWKI